MHTLDPSLATTLDRFVRAQDPVYETVLEELRNGRKRSHWVWFIFPQLRSLGRSNMAEHYGLADVAEARRFLAHDVLGPRLRQCSGVLLTIGDKSAYEVMGSPDDLKLCSSMTLFAAIAEDNSPFHAVLTKFFDDVPDPQTRDLFHD